jgi:hypothetical protein
MAIEVRGVRNVTGVAADVVGVVAVPEARKVSPSDSAKIRQLRDSARVRQPRDSSVPARKPGPTIPRKK